MKFDATIWGGISAMLLGAMLWAAGQKSFAQTNLNQDFEKPHQKVSRGEPPLAPSVFNPDAGIAPSKTLPPTNEIILQSRPTNTVNTTTNYLFNPDPGAVQNLRPPQPRNFFETNYGQPPEVAREKILPPPVLERREIVPLEKITTNSYGLDPLPENLKLPRYETRATEKPAHKFHARDYPLDNAAPHYPADAERVTDRWRIGFTPWRRYTSGSTELPYGAPPALWHPYRQSLLKGDSPIIGQDIFLNLTAESETLFEARRLPTPSGVSSLRPNSSEFFGESESLFFQNNFSFAMELFQGETAFQPVHWAIKLRPVFNVNYVDAPETGVVNPNPARGETRLRSWWALQEGFAELHLGDLSDTYDFFAVRAGNQVFNSDFRGFIFNDINFGGRLFGNIDNNRYQYNVAAFDMREKESNSELNLFDQRDQRVFIANIYRQDFLKKGYTAQLSFHANLDEGRTHYDRNGNLVRPEPFGTVRPHDVNGYYLGWAGDGHIGKLNVNHAFYQVFGHDDFNGLAGRPVDINAQMGALEISYDRDWVRYKASFFYASGDGHAEDGEANGFDTIVDNPNFTGGPFSYFVRQGFNLGGTGVGFKTRGSLVPNLRTSKTEGQANFVNPGLFLYGVGMEIEVTPRLRSFVNANYIRFAETDPVKTALLTDKVDAEIGLDLSIGFQYRPLLTDNVIVSAGFGTLIPGRGFRDIYRRSTDPIPGYNSRNRRGQADDFLYSGIIAVTLTY
ncbi:MAG: hypothetical protein ABI042_06375 [Verrucomicrobiota bacterium]